MKQAVISKGVKFLMHFTQESNIDSILKYGLLPKKELSASVPVATVNDSLRLDLRENMSSLSISFPNYKLFFKWRKAPKNERVKWGVIVFNASILYHKECLFCQTNAANGLVSAEMEEHLKGVSAFYSLFDEIEGKPSRQELGLDSYYTTDPQAEVLVKGIIEPEYITGLAFDDQILSEEYQRKYPAHQIKMDKELFRYRKDYMHWKEPSLRDFSVPF